MKTIYSKYRFRAAAVLLCALFSLAALTGCSSDTEPTQVEKPVPDNGMAIVNLVFSAPSIETRTADYSPIDTEAHEDRIDNLWIYFFEDSGNLAKAVDVTLADNFVIKDNTFQTVLSGIAIPGGKYRVYVIANLKDYADTAETADISPAEVNKTINTTSPFQESTLQNFTFHTKSTAEGDASGVFINALPMAAYADDIDLDPNTTDSENTIDDDGTITLVKGAATIQATMTYLCSKIRYSFFFDNTETTDQNGNKVLGFSYPLKSIEYDVVGIHNAEAYATLYGTEPNVPQGKDKYVEKNIIDLTDDPTQGCVASHFPAEGYDAWAAKDIPDKLIAWDEEEDGDYPTTGKIAYQGLVYIPQNSATSQNEKTYLHLKVKLDGNTTSTEYVIYLPDTDLNNTLQRGNFYDIIGKITGNGISFNVRVKPWVKGNASAIPMPLGL